MKNCEFEFVFDKELEHEIEKSVEELMATFIPKTKPIAKDSVFYEKMKQAVDSLEDDEKNVVELMYGVKDGQAKTPEEVAKILSLTVEDVKKINTTALRKARSFLSK